MFKHSQLFGVSMAAFLLMLGDGMVLALLPKTVITLTNSGSFVGYLASTYAVAQVISQLPVGMLADRFGSKLFLCMGYIFSVIAGLLFYFTDNMYLIFCGRVLQGIGEAPILSLAPAMLSIRYATNKGKAIGLYNASIYLGLTIGPIMRVVLLEGWSDNQIFLLYAVLCFLGAGVIAFSMKNKVDNKYGTKEMQNIKSLLILMKNPQTLTVLWGIALYGAGWGIYMTIIPAFLLIAKHYNQSYINLFFSLFYVAISMAQIVTGWLSDKLGRQLFMLTGMVAAAAGLRISSYFDSLALTIVLCFASFGLGTYYLASMAFLNDEVPAAFKGAISGIYYLFCGIGMFWGPLIMNNYIQNNGYQAGFNMFSLILGMQTILLFITKIHSSRTTREMH